LRDADDLELVSRAVAEVDTRAFGELVRRHQSRIRGFLRRMARDADLADDLAQDCFVQAWEKLHTFSGKGSFAGWLLRIAYTTFLQAKRRSSRYGEILETVRETPGEERAVPAESEDAGDLEKLLAVLDEQERAVMILSYAFGMSHREIGESTGLPVGTVKSLIFRGKDKIRERFDIERHQYG
jgi:RNA polymerase sigma-70 factor (ECF subfamily)